MKSKTCTRWKGTWQGISNYNMKRARDYVPVPGRDGRVVLVSTSIRISYKSIKKEQVSLDRRRFEEFWPQYAASSGSPDNITSRSPAGPSLTETVQTYLLVLRTTTVLRARAKFQYMKQPEIHLHFNQYQNTPAARLARHVWNVEYRRFRCATCCS